MVRPAQNLQAVIEHLKINRNELARALGVDSSLISRWLSSQRNLRAASPQIGQLAEYILKQAKKIADIEWLKEQFRIAGLSTDTTAVYNVKQSLILWLATDGEELRRNFDVMTRTYMPQKGTMPTQHFEEAIPQDHSVKLGTLEIAYELNRQLSKLLPHSSLDIFLSSDQIATIVNESIVSELLQATSQAVLSIRMLVCVSGNTQAISQLVDAYMQPLVSGHLQLSIVHGMPQAVTYQMQMIIPKKAVLLITETPQNEAPPVASIITNPLFVSETVESFEKTMRYSQPVLHVYGDEYTRNILEILYMEFCTDGRLDVVKDSINPMYLSTAAYDCFLKTRGHSEAEFAWRSAEFVRFHGDMIENLKAGTVFREILSLHRLNEVVKQGSCRMAGLYFMERGYIDLDRYSCIALLTGYMQALQSFENFELLILDDISLLHENNCWQLKQNRHVAINCWSGAEPVMIYSDQVVLIGEFQAHFDRLWTQGQAAVCSRANTIAILRDVVERLKRNE